MRLLLWVLLVTLVTLQASTDAASSKIANADTTKTSKLESIQAPVLTARALSPEHIADDKRGLRVHANDDATDAYTEEERAISISSILDRMKAGIKKMSKSMANAVIKRLDKYIEAMAMELYKMGVTPANLQARIKGGSARKNKVVAAYTAWYDKNVAAGVIKALD